MTTTGMKKWLNIYTPMWLQVAWDMKWFYLDVLFFFAVPALLIFSFASVVTYPLSHPEEVGAWFGRLLNGYEATKP